MIWRVAIHLFQNHDPKAFTFEINRLEMSISSSVFTLKEPWIGILNDAANSKGLVSYEDFSRLALFHPEHGYYASQRYRVGKSEQSDFYTSSSHREVFPRLVAEAITKLLSEKDFHCENFYELGAEPDSDLWQEQALPCPSRKILRLGDPLSVEGPAVVFSNELFDAQPFQRWLAQDGRWLSILLRIDGDKLSEVIDDDFMDSSLKGMLSLLPEPPSFDYHLDLSSVATSLLKSLVSKPWKGLFVAFDYGKSWEQLIHETPQGTARAYSKHTQTPELHFSPGEQDLTTHVCWDFLIQALEEAGFEDIRLTHQSRFFMERATASIQSIVSQPEGLTSKLKSQLLELISPGFFGQRFQVLTAFRR